MNTKLIPVMANLTMLLLLIGVTEISLRAHGIPEPTNIASAAQIRIIDEIDDIYDIADISPIESIDIASIRAIQSSIDI